MQIRITRFFREVEHATISASFLELGQDAGKITWHNAKEKAASAPLLSSEAEFESFREWIVGFGAWDREEIAAWDATECNALLMQYIAGDIREAEALASDDDGEIDWSEYAALAEEGTLGGTMFRADDGEIYFEMS